MKGYTRAHTFMRYIDPHSTCKVKKFFRGIYSELTTNYRGGNRFPFFPFNLTIERLWDYKCSFVEWFGKRNWNLASRGENPSIFQVRAPTSDISSIPGQIEGVVSGRIKKEVNRRESIGHAQSWTINHSWQKEGLRRHDVSSKRSRSPQGGQIAIPEYTSEI